MAVIGQTGRARSTLHPFALASALISALTLTGKAAIAPHKASLANLWSIPLTVAGVGCVDTGVFFASVVAGWIVTGLSLILLEHVIADER